MVQAITAQAKTAPASSETQRRDRALKTVCVEFESMLLAEMFKSMRDSEPEDGLFPKGQGEQVFQEMLDGEYARGVSRMNPNGLAATLYRQMQEMIPPDAPAPADLPQWTESDGAINF